MILASGETSASDNVNFQCGDLGSEVAFRESWWDGNVQQTVMPLPYPWMTKIWWTWISRRGADFTWWTQAVIGLSPPSYLTWWDKGNPGVMGAKWLSIPTWVPLICQICCPSTRLMCSLFLTQVLSDSLWKYPCTARIRLKMGTIEMPTNQISQRFFMPFE